MRILPRRFSRKLRNRRSSVDKPAATANDDCLNDRLNLILSLRKYALRIQRSADRARQKIGSHEARKYAGRKAFSWIVPPSSQTTGNPERKDRKIFLHPSASSSATNWS